MTLIFRYRRSSFKVINKSGINLRSKTYDSPFGFASVNVSEEDGGKLYTYQNIPAIDHEDMVPNPQKIVL
ncbi:hypothetical protein [Chryseobacterium indoltheticum]|uniref:hypothetical protein n=1 Tax=Chryseobacterium indoltheticum TaxID=254 RepID=UPI003F491188